MKACEAAAAAEAVGVGGVVDEWGYAELIVSYASNGMLRKAHGEVNDRGAYHANGRVGRQASPREDGRHCKRMRWRSARRGRCSAALS